MKIAFIRIGMEVGRGGYRMIVYLIMFVISLLFIYGGLKNEDKRVKISLFAFGIFLPCLMAGMRNDNIGTDTTFYAKKIYDLARESSDLGSFFGKSISSIRIDEPLYIIIVYVSAKLFNSFPVLLFLTELLIILPIFFALLFSVKSERGVLFGMSCFYLFVYNNSLNLMRQSIALAFVIMGLGFLAREKKLLSSIVLLVAFFFHKTALIAVVAFFVYFMIKKVEWNKVRWILLGFIVLSGCLVVFCKPVLELLSEVGIFPGASEYIQRYSMLDFDVTHNAIFLMCLLIALIDGVNVLHCIRRIWQDNDAVDTLRKYAVFLGLESLILLQMGTFIHYTDRISYYFFYPLLLLILPMLLSRRGRFGWYEEWITIACLSVYWAVVFSVFGVGETIPYQITDFSMIFGGRG